MKIEQVIALHLLNFKQVTLQGIGTFTVDPSVAMPADTEKDFVIPESALSFEYNPKAAEDAALIASIIKYTTKIKPLASADLDSFLMLGRQFLNIGKPFTLDKLGTLDKAQTGELIFVPGQYVTPKIEAPKALKENENEESSGLFNDYNREPANTNKQTFAIVAGIIALALTCWAVYHFVFAKKSPAENFAMAQPVADTSLPKKDTAINTFTSDASLHKTMAANDSSFNIIIRETNNKTEAMRYFKRLSSWGHHLILFTADSVNYKIEEVIKLPLTDTARVKDSLSKFYDTPVYTEPK